MKRKSARAALASAAATPPGNPPNQLATTAAGMCMRNGACDPRTGSHTARTALATSAVSTPIAAPTHQRGAPSADADNSGARNTTPPRGTCPEYSFAVRCVLKWEGNAPLFTVVLGCGAGPSQATRSG